MQRRRTIIRALIVVAGVWAAVWAVRAFADSRRATAASLRQSIAAVGFDDWSGHDTPPDPAAAAARQRELRKLAAIYNRLDFHEREKAREQRLGEELARRLTTAEKALFIELTVSESMNQFMEALDAMPPAERRRFVKEGLEEIAEGRTGDEIRRGKELLDQNLLARITSEGMRAYYEKASADTKLDLAPLMEAMNEVMQGLRGNDFGPPRR